LSAGTGDAIERSATRPELRAGNAFVRQTSDRLPSVRQWTAREVILDAVFVLTGGGKSDAA